MKWDSGLEIVGYVNNIFDVNPKLSLDRERGLRAGIGYNVGQPRTIGLTVRKTFGGHPCRRRRRLSRVAPPPPPPAVEEPARRRRPATASAAAAARSGERGN